MVVGNHHRLLDRLVTWGKKKSLRILWEREGMDAPITKLPSEILEHIFEYLTADELAT